MSNSFLMGAFWGPPACYHWPHADSANTRNSLLVGRTAFSFTGGVLPRTPFAMYWADSQLMKTCMYNQVPTTHCFKQGLLCK